VPQIRIILALTPEGLRAAVAVALADAPDIFVVADASDEVTALIDAGLADVAIVGMTGGELPAVAERLLDEHPGIAVLAVDIEGEQGLLYQLRPELTPIDAVTPVALVAAIRRAAAELPV
jgi:hypothetical protein